MQESHYRDPDNSITLISAALILVFSFVVLHIAYGGPGSLTPPNGSGSIRAVAGKVGIGFLPTDNLGSTFSSKGGVSVGAGYASVAAPLNGMIIEGSLGVGIANPEAKLEVDGGGIIINGTPQRGYPNERVPQGNTVSVMPVGYPAVTTPISVTIGRDGLPLIAYMSDSSLMLIRCADIICSPPPISSIISVIANVQVGRFATIAIGSDGNPIIAFQAKDTISSTNALRLAKCSDPKCSLTVSVSDEEVEDNLNSNIFISMTIGKNGMPIIAYLGINSGADALSIARCNDLSCSSSDINDITIADDDCDVLGIDSFGTHNSIAIGADGYPAIVSYCRSSPKSLYFVHCASDDCRTSDAPVLLDNGTTLGIGKFASLAIGRDGLPVVAYYDSETNSGALKIGKCLNATCGTDVSPAFTTAVVDDSVGFQDGLQASLAIGMDGLPVVAYRGLNPGVASYLRFVKCGTPSCADSLGAPVRSIFNIDSESPSGAYPSVAIGADGLPIVAYIDYSVTPNRIGVVHCGSENCVSYWTRR